LPHVGQIGKIVDPYLTKTKTLLGPVAPTLLNCQLLLISD